jgi:hypothetical protein
VAHALPDEVQLALECVPLDVGRGRNDQLLDVRHRRARRLAEIRFVGSGRNDAPANETLTFLGANLGHERLAPLAFRCVGRQEHDSGGVFARAGQRHAEVALRDLGEKLVRQGGQDSCTVARVRLRAAGATVIHAAQQMIRVEQNLVAAKTLDVRDEPDTAAVVLEFRPVETVRRRQAITRMATHSGASPRPQDLTNASAEASAAVRRDAFSLPAVMVPHERWPSWLRLYKLF